MLQMVVDSTRHILRSTLKGLSYLHSVNIVHNNVKCESTANNTSTCSFVTHESWPIRF